MANDNILILQDQEGDQLKAKWLRGECVLRSTLTESGEQVTLWFSENKARELRDWLTAKLEEKDGND
jgi:hypothetical protein